MDKEAIGGVTQINPPYVWRIKDTTANPAPLGLMGFGMTLKSDLKCLKCLK